MTSSDRRSPTRYQDADACVDFALERVGRRVVLGTPLALGKANDLVNAFYRRAKEDLDLDLTIITALTLSRPTGSSELERRLVEPLAERLFGDMPELEYATDRQRDAIPPNVRVLEFYYAPGSQLGNERAQQDHIASNYSFVVRDALDLGINVLAQMVSEETVDGRSMLSLSCNSDLTVDLLPKMLAADRPVALLAQVNRNLPFLYGEAMVPPEAFDAVVDHPRYQWQLPSTPNMPISTADHVIGLQASALVRDGGSLQLGIGALGDAITYALELRHEDNECWNAVLDDLGVTESWGGLVERVGGTGTFERGLYGATEMLVDGFLDLYRSGILKRRVYPDAALQRLLDADLVGEEVTAEMLPALVEGGVVGERLSQTDVALLQELGIFREGVVWEWEDGGRLRVTRRDGDVSDGGGFSGTVPADLTDPAVREILATYVLGDRLRGARLAHSAFFLGPGSFYEGLRELSREERELFEMTSISYVNELYGPHQELKRAQRRHARFLNSGLKATLLGSVASETLEDGQVISGVGGQYNFVAMAHALEEGRSVLMVKAAREGSDGLETNVVSRYPNATIPRHLRDLVITEYGIADLRGKSDADCADAMIRIADSRFQATLQREAQRAGKLPADHAIPERHRHNTPQRLEKALAPYRERGLFGALPFGSDVTDEERVLVKALKALKKAAEEDRWSLLDRAVLGKTLRPPKAARPYLERMGLDRPRGVKERGLRRAVVAALALVGEI